MGTAKRNITIRVRLIAIPHNKGSACATTHFDSGRLGTFRHVPLHCAPSPARLQCRRTSASLCAAGRALPPHRTVRSCRQVELRFLNDAPLQIIQSRGVLK